MRRAAKIDANQPAVVEALRRIGAAVTPLHTVGNGVADLLVSYRQAWMVMEVKDGALPPSKRTHTELERAWIAQQRAPVFIVTNPIEAIDVARRVR